ncbi:FG-GAP repeat domain-containing protein [Aureliella helgolandensis]|uniref:FG-GAP repeat domain-containing protein n=1 Tax=Aureliella helgolandensis TaxID=2527968 RepID=UPI00119F86C6|nr:VCBS repeat-containing protein [Aureliella helgolandensis]
MRVFLRQFLGLGAASAIRLARAASCFGLLATSSWAEVWEMHSIDNSGQGADGVRLADFNQDGLPDIVTGWEESGVVRLYLNPGYDQAEQAWPNVTVGSGDSPEDAVAFDIDSDGKLDIVSCHEGKQKQLLVHRFNGELTDNAALLEPQNWQTSAFDQLNGQQWMFAAPIQLRGGRSALVAGAKNSQATLTLLTQPDRDSSELSNWQTQKLRDAGWTMTLSIIDMDDDGDDDIVFSDRKRGGRGVAWLEQPNDHAALSVWKEHSVGGHEYEAMFLSASKDEMLLATRNSVWLEYRRTAAEQWQETVHPNPPNIPFGKAIRRIDSETLIMTANSSADGIKSHRQAIWIKRADTSWTPIANATRAKYDRIECLDLDGDGDLDVLTCEEKQNLGVVWYENPALDKS